MLVCCWGCGALLLLAEEKKKEKGRGKERHMTNERIHNEVERGGGDVLKIRK